MKRVMLTALIGLLSTALLLDPQPVFADGCTHSVNDGAQLHRLEHAKPVTLDYQAGQSALLSGNEDGSANLAGRSVVGIEFEPSGQMIGYRVETLPPIDVTPLLALGTNTVSLTAVDPQDTAWLRIIPPCSASPQPDATAAAGHKAELQPVPSPFPVLTATRVPMSTVTLAGSVDGTIIPPVATVRHTPKTVEATPVAPEAADGAEIYTLLRHLGQLVMGFPWRGVILPLPPIDLRTGWQWVMWLLETWLK